MSLGGFSPSVGEINVEINAQDIRLFLIGNLLTADPGCSDSGFLNILGPGEETNVLTTVFNILDNILWGTSFGIDMPAVYEVHMNCSTGLDSDISDSVAVDYALILPPPTMSLQNQLLFVNYTDDTIISEGQWQDSVPSGGPGMSSITKNATLKFPFAGWNITLLGYFDSSTLGNITLGISVDEQAEFQLKFSGLSQAASRGLAYFEYFTLVDEANSGNHIITVNILEASLFQMFCFRGFTYIPDFATLNDLPDLSVPASSSPTSTSSTTSAMPGPSSHQGLHDGAIAGVVVGVIAMICLVGVIFWVMKRRAQKGLSLSPAQAWMRSQPALVPDSSTVTVSPLPGPANITPFEKSYISDVSLTDMSYMIAASHNQGITPFSKSYITSMAALANIGDTAQDQEQLVHGSTITLPPGEPTVHVYSPPEQMAAEPPNSGGNGSNGQNGDQTSPPIRDQDRTELLLERLNSFMNAFQQPPAYGQEE
ncbi:hypothetical protein BDP27DRAFT_1429157 [Rhodocollybia butyracea]|uniref:Peptidase A1 domain-containing protein n=1 Tax=Rhodocollybia butyracea TaxID=206335 RepID=A0A9P5PD69_9AGAR|nr:hypothetical protein BDP27DRAFT_1429157 [Rhodocollybia butyracea]